MVKFIVPYIKITRPANAAIAGCAVFIGMFIVAPTETARLPHITVLLAAAAAAALAYGNVINDILDVKSDRVSHPDRPLASGAIGVRGAGVFAAALALLSLSCAAFASAFYLAATIVPIALLTLYSIYFKRTRLAGNIIVATLTAYALLYGALPHPEVKILFVPAFLAFWLNFCRELVKDVQDAEGDRAAGWKTSADLPAGAVRGLLVNSAAVYLMLALAPSLVLHNFDMIYTVICIAAAIPLHIYWVILLLKSGTGINKYAKRIGLILKLEMVAGLIALAFDRAFYYFMVR
jgi:geranylgeranylglycerol-phosphate geranylgeranyltransferase